MCIEDPYEENINLARRIDAEKAGTVGGAFVREYQIMEKTCSSLDAFYRYFFVFVFLLPVKSS